MKKIFLLIFTAAFFVSCETGNPLDPAKGIDSQGNTTLFSGKVLNAGTPVAGTDVTCFRTGGYGGDVQLWQVQTDSQGEYVYRDDLSDIYSYYSLKLAVTGYSDVIIQPSESTDYDSDRESCFDPVIVTDFILP